MPPATKIPVYRIDLALPPEQRYVRVAKDFSHELRAVAPLYDLVLAQILVYPPIIRVAQFLVRLYLRRVFDDDETREIRSIAEVAGVELHLLVALNTLLDCLLGCTSGTVPVCGGGDDGEARLMHFRTLDWGMPQLGDLLVQLDFVDSQAPDPEHVLARSITYAGFVGTLTGVRPGLSLSLNHRPLMNVRTNSSIFHQVLVLLGRRPSISSILRQVLLSPKLPGATEAPDGGLVAFAKSITEKPSPPCYLLFSTPTEAVVIQKDFVGGNIKSTRDFIAQANHDTDHTSCCGAKEFHHRQMESEDAAIIAQDWISQSAERQNFVRDNWSAFRERAGERTTTKDDSSTLNGSCIALAVGSRQGHEGRTGVTQEMLQKWVMSEPVFNEFTHFATVMDPSSGDVVCLERGNAFSQTAPLRTSNSLAMGFSARLTSLLCTLLHLPLLSLALQAQIEVDLIFPQPNKTYKPIYPFPVVFAIRNASQLWLPHGQALPFQLSWSVTGYTRHGPNGTIDDRKAFGEQLWTSKDTDAPDPENDTVIFVDAPRNLADKTQRDFWLHYHAILLETCGADTAVGKGEDVRFADVVSFSVDPDNGEIPDFEDTMMTCPTFIGSYAIEDTSKNCAAMAPNASVPAPDPCGIRGERGDLAAWVRAKMLQRASCENGTWPDRGGTLAPGVCNEVESRGAKVFGGEMSGRSAGLVVLALLVVLVS
ncbi:hypothetical protein CkaCkLH20_11104 [Colletotrichum karsti]|uniref:ceramidase n=1 Tax=Colletotrichum karsti TaxID=1095194 RepID=A0A9P6LGH8_9PEZI|nr:uncharacterized protein CkaCkLH20_11104 [Colletotrichum karsti]KAF9871457.1 hypothetical protein CkaCkLH20_11104 [Colletotrichum karsti]